MFLRGGGALDINSVRKKPKARMRPAAPSAPSPSAHGQLVLTRSTCCPAPSARPRGRPAARHAARAGVDPGQLLAQHRGAGRPGRLPRRCRRGRARRRRLARLVRRRGARARARARLRGAAQQVRAHVHRQGAPAAPRPRANRANGLVKRLCCRGGPGAWLNRRCVSGPAAPLHMPRAAAGVARGPNADRRGRHDRRRAGAALRGERAAQHGGRLGRVAAHNAAHLPAVAGRALRARASTAWRRARACSRAATSGLLRVTARGAALCAAPRP